jgi:hypothetical protein
LGASARRSQLHGNGLFHIQLRKIARITAYAVKISRDLAKARGSAGSPAQSQLGDDGRARGDYHFAKTYQTLYSTKIETVMIK